MREELRIREVFKLVHRHNPISGHRWTEHGKTTGYEVVGKFGVISKHRKLERAEAALASYQE